MYRILLRTVIGLVAVVGGSAARTVDIPLQVSYRDAATDGIHSDGMTSFTGWSSQYVHGSEDNALVLIQATGNYRFSTRLDTRKPLRRHVCLAFAGQASPFASPYCVDILIGMHGDGDIQDMRYGQILTKRVRHSWDDGGYEYALGFGTDVNGDGVFDETPPVNVTCVAPDSSPSSACTQWTMSSAGPASLARQALLSKGKYGPRELIGYYNMPFEVTFTRK